MAMTMAKLSSPCPSTTFHSRRVLRLEQRKIPGEVRAISTNFRAWERIRVASFSTNCGARERVRVANCGAGELDFRVRLNTRRCDSQADVTQVLPSQSGVRKVAAINRVYDEFQDGPEIDGHGDGGETSPLEDENTGKEVQIDLQLPRRRLLVEFTCNVCQTRTQRLVNPEAYKRGTVYVQVQCGGCEAFHQLVDNLGLVVEYDFREETDRDSS